MKKKERASAKNKTHKPGWLFRAFRFCVPALEEFRQNKSEFLCCVIAGLIMILPWPRFDWWPLAWFGMTPFFWALGRVRGRLAVWCGLAFGLPFFYGNLFWLNTLSAFNPFVPIGILLLAVYPALYCALFSWLAAEWLRKFPHLKYLLVPSLWCALEYLRSLGRLGFPWIDLGHSQWRWSGMLQLAAITGVFGISFLILLSNLLLTELSSRLSRRSIRPSLAGLLTIGWFGVLIVLGLSLRASMSERSSPYLRVALIQPNIDQVTKVKSYGMFDVTEEEMWRLQQMINRQNAELTNEALAENSDGLDLIVWPESANTHPFFSDARLDDARAQQQEIRGLARRAGAPILLGANRFLGIDERENLRLCNSAFLIEPRVEGLDQHYDKMRLVPFGEHLPYFNLIPGLRSIVDIYDFNEGQKMTVFEAPYVEREREILWTDQPQMKFSALICFESSIAPLARRAVRNGAQFLVIITNDGWYGASKGPAHHALHAVFRAVETRRWVVRCANTGVSMFVNPHGVIVEELGLLQRGVLSAKIAPLQTESFYVRFGDWFAWLCVLISAGAIALDRRANRRAKHEP